MTQQNNPVGKNSPPSFAAPDFNQNSPQSLPAASAAAGAQGKAPAAYAQPAAPGQQPPASVKTPAAVLPITKTDGIFALVFLVLGWLYYKIVFCYNPIFYNGEYYWGLAVFSLVFTAAVLAFGYSAGKRPTRESWFWLAVLLLLGLTSALPYVQNSGYSGLYTMHFEALHLTACYWVLLVFGRTGAAGGKTSSWLPLDLFNALVILPFGNFWRLPAAIFHFIGQGLSALRQRLAHRRKSSRLPAVLLGLLLAGLCIGLVLPLLFAADSGFAALFESAFASVGSWFSALFGGFAWLDAVNDFLLESLLFLPIGFFLYGLVYGCVHSRRTEAIRKEPVERLHKSLRVLPRITAAVALLGLAFVYLVFIALQAGYLFSAFFGRLPEGFSYAEYARSGFFELCRIGVINLCILLCANLLSRTASAQNSLLRLCNLWVSGLTLLLVTTALAKMGLYMRAYGLTTKRVLAVVLLLWLGGVFLLVMIHQFKPLPLVRWAVFFGTVLFALVLCLPTEPAIKSFNLAFGYSGQEATVLLPLPEEAPGLSS